MQANRAQIELLSGRDTLPTKFTTTCSHDPNGDGNIVRVEDCVISLTLRVRQGEIPKNNSEREQSVLFGRCKLSEWVNACGMHHDTSHMSITSREEGRARAVCGRLLGWCGT